MLAGDGALRFNCNHCFAAQCVRQVIDLNKINPLGTRIAKLELEVNGDLHFDERCTRAGALEPDEGVPTSVTARLPDAGAFLLFCPA